MSTIRGRPLTFRPKGITDAVDGTNVASGAMVLLANLIPDPATAGVWVPRPAAVPQIDFIADRFTTPGFVSGYIVIGNTVYGTVASGRNPGHDEPFCFDLATSSFVEVIIPNSTILPVSPPSTGAWTPPVYAQVGSRIIFTHPGFPGGATKFGWFDVSGFTLAGVGNLTFGSAVVTGAFDVLGVQPGMTITDGGANIPIGAWVVSTTNFVLDTTGTTASSIHLTGLASTTGVAIGQGVAGSGIPAGATVTTIVSSTAVDISLAATASASGVAITFTGSTITMSITASGSLNASSITVAGGTLTAPLWGAGDTDRNNLPSVPLGVGQMNGRAYFVCGTNGIPFSDSGFACRMSNATSVQTLLTNDGLAATAIGALQLTSLLGGIVQSLIVFEGVSKMQQITGDLTTNNLAMNSLPVATGTLAPLSICSTKEGLAFVSPEGLRTISFLAVVSDPIGFAGAGITMPFINSVQPSRICAAANRGVVRVSNQNGLTAGGSQEEYWYDLSRKTWSGPHTSAASLIQPWSDTFLMTFIAQPDEKIYQSDSVPLLASTYIERNAQLSWAYRPTLLPDAGTGSMVAVIEMTLACELAPQTTASVIALSDTGFLLDQTTVVGDSAATIWGEFLWGYANWGQVTGVYRQRAVNWFKPLVFRQGTFLVSGQSAANVRVGNLYMMYQDLGYVLEN